MASVEVTSRGGGCSRSVWAFGDKGGAAAGNLWSARVVAFGVGGGEA